jgi:hypothetical protein
MGCGDVTDRVCFSNSLLFRAVNCCLLLLMGSVIVDFKEGIVF